MIKDDYVSFETAKLLKEKGFDSNCFYVWVSADNQTPSLLATANFVEGEMTTNRETLDVVTQYHMNTYESNNKIESFLCPTLQMAMKWLREKYNLHCHIDCPLLLFYEWRYTIRDLDKDEWIVNKYSEGKATYEEACEEAIKYCLENLI